MTSNGAPIQDEILPGILAPASSAKWVMENTKDNAIHISEEAERKVARMIIESSDAQLHQLDFASCEVHPKTADKAAIDWIFFVNSINFSFWTDQFHYEVTFPEGKTYDGYYALCAAVNRALAQGIPLTDANFMVKLEEAQLDEIFRGTSIIPLLCERLEILRNNGRILLEKFNGSFYNCVLESQGSARKLLHLIITSFPNFRDFATFRGRRVSFLKRAQILVADVHNCLLANKSVMETGFCDIDTLTMFADYRVPQALVGLGVLNYSQSVLDVLSTKKLLISGSELEVQIRAFSILACHQISEYVRELATSDRFKQFNSVDVDIWLWLWRRRHADELEERSVPYHRCRCIFY